MEKIRYKKNYRNKNQSRNSNEFSRNLESVNGKTSRAKFKSRKEVVQEENLEYIFVDKEFIFFTDDESVQNSLSDLSLYSDSEEDLDIPSVSSEVVREKKNKFHKLTKPSPLSVIDVLNSQNLLPLRNISSENSLDQFSYSRSPIAPSNSGQVSPMLFNPMSGEMESVSTITSKFPINSGKKKEEFIKTKKSFKKEKDDYKRETRPGFKLLLSSSKNLNNESDEMPISGDHKIIPKSLIETPVYRNREQDLFQDSKYNEKKKKNKNKDKDYDSKYSSSKPRSSVESDPQIKIKLNPFAQEFRPPI